MAYGRKPDLDGLRDLIDEGDRSRARFFVGRDGLIGNIRSICALARDGHPAGVTRVIQGAPGAGKTALLSRLQESWIGPDDPHVLSCQIGDVADPVDLVDTIIEKTAPGLVRQFRSAYPVGPRSRIGFPGIFEIEGGVGRTEPPPATPWKWLHERRPAEHWSRPLCLLVDEIQNLKSDHAEALRSLHQGTHGFPIVPVLAGLAHSRDVLAACGISRLSRDAVQTLGALEAGEPSLVVRQMLDHYGIDVSGADPDRWAGLIEGRSDRWPQHLQTGVAGLADGLIKAQGVLARVDETAILARERAWRIGAYRARRSDGIRLARCLVGGVMAEIGRNGVDEDGVVDIVERRARIDGPAAWRLPEGMSAGAFVKHLIARGALQLNDQDLLACPIPGFRRFLIDEGKRSPPGPA